MTPMDRIEQVLKEKGISNPEFQKKLGIQSQHWNNWKKRGVPYKMLFPIAEELGLNIDWLAHGKGKKYSDRLQESHADYIDVISGLVPLISWVKASSWAESIENYAIEDVEKWLPCPEKHSKSTYALKVIGDSMTSPYLGNISYPDGTFIYVDPEREVVNGSKVIAKVTNKNEVTFKVYREDAGKKWLMPLNPVYEKIEFIEGMTICGVVIFSGRAE